MSFFGTGVISSGAQTKWSVPGAKRVVTGNDQSKLVSLRDYVHARCLALVSGNTTLADDIVARISVAGFLDALDLAVEQTSLERLVNSFDVPAPAPAPAPALTEWQIKAHVVRAVMRDYLIQRQAPTSWGKEAGREDKRKAARNLIQDVQSGLDTTQAALLAKLTTAETANQTACSTHHRYKCGYVG